MPARLATVILLLARTAVAAPFAYIPNEDDDTVSVIDLATNTVTTTIDVDREPHDVIVNHDGSRAYVANREGATGSIMGTISVISTATNTVVDTWPSCQPKHFALDPTSSHLYVSTNCWKDSSDHTFIMDYDTGTGDRVRDIDVGPKGWDIRGMSMSLDGSKLYVAASKGIPPGILIFDTAAGTQLPGIPTSEFNPGYIARNPNGTRLYLTNRDDRTLSVIDSATGAILTSINTGRDPLDVAVDSTGELIYVTNNDDDTVTAIDGTTNLPVATIPVGASPVGVSFGPRGDRAYVTCSGTDIVSVIDTNTHTVINNVLVGDRPLGFANFTTPAAFIYADPSHHDFGQISAGSTSSDLQIDIHNEGTGVLTLGTIHLGGADSDDFALTFDPCSDQGIATNGSCTVITQFGPGSFGDKVAELRVPSNDATTPLLSVSLSGSARSPSLYILNAVRPMTTYTILCGSAQLNETAIETRVVMNEGNETLSIGTLGGTNGLAAPFTLGGDNCSDQDLAPGSSCDFTVLFEPTAAGTATDDFDLPSNDPERPSFTVGVSGWGTPDPVGKIFVADSIDPAIDFWLPYGDIDVGDTSSAEVSLFNTGNAGALSVSAVTITGADAAEFSFDGGDGTNDTCGNVPITVPGPINLARPPQLQPHPCTIAVSFDPASAGDKDAVLEIESNDPNATTMSVVLTGRGLGPILSLIDTLDFGDVPVGTPLIRQVAIENSGTADLNLSSIALSGDATFELDLTTGSSPCGDGALVISPSHLCTFVVTFAPDGETLFSGSVTVTSDDPTEPSATIALSGTGVAVESDGGPTGGDSDGTTPTGDTDGGCGCAARHGAPVWLAALLIFALARRRR